MHVISRKALVDFCKIHPDAETPLTLWHKTAIRNEFQSLQELKQTFGSVDYVRVGTKGVYVFNIGGNKYRLVAQIYFASKLLLIRHVLTHQEYDREGWKK